MSRTEKEQILCESIPTIDKEHISCIYTSASINHISGCSSMTSVARTTLKSTYFQDVLAFGCSNFVCLAEREHCSDCAEMRNCSKDALHPFKVICTLKGHEAPVRCVRWITCNSTQSSNQSWQNLLLISADSCGKLLLWTCGSETAFQLCDVNVGSDWRISANITVPAGSTINSIDGCVISSVNTSNSQTILISCASDSTVHTWFFNANVSDQSGCIVTEDSSIAQSHSSIVRTPSLCVCIRSFCFNLGFSGPISKNLWLYAVIVGMDSGQTELWSTLLDCERSVGSVEPLNFVNSATISGHQNWVRCIDVTLNHRCSLPTIMFATGSQDNIVRVWSIRVQSDDPSFRTVNAVKVANLHLPLSSVTLSLYSETVLSGHENWITGVRWAPISQTTSFPPALLTASMDKLMIVWSPSADQSLGSGDSCDVWLEQSRVGNLTEQGLGFIDCHWLMSLNQAIFGLHFQGGLSAWYYCASEEKWVSDLPLNGHYGPVSDITWMSPPLSVDLTTIDTDSVIPTYLLSAGADQTVRLHTYRVKQNHASRFWHELARPQIHGYDMNAIASISPTLYVSAGDEKVVRVFSATESFRESFKVALDAFGNPKFDEVFPSKLMPKGAIQPPLGLSNQALLESDKNISTTQNNDSHTNDLQNEDILPKPKSILPSEENLQYLTLWPETKKLYGHPYEVYCLAAHPNRLLIASACTASKPEHANIILWNGSSDWTIHQRLTHHQLTVTQLVWSYDGTRLLALSRDRTWSLWSTQLPITSDMPTYSLRCYPLKGQSHSRIIWTGCWSPDDRYFFTGSRDKNIFCWSGSSTTPSSINAFKPEACRRLDAYGEFPHAVTALDVCNAPNKPNSYLMAVGLESGQLLLIRFHESEPGSDKPFIWSCLTQFPPAWCHVPGKKLRRLAFDSLNVRRPIPRKVQLATAGDDGIIRVFEIRT